jgi:hypothetical protein
MSSQLFLVVVLMTIDFICFHAQPLNAQQHAALMLVYDGLGELKR